MKKRIIALMLWLSGGVVCAQSINSQSLQPNGGPDGSFSQAARVLTLPQAQSTPGTTPTPQYSNWYPMNGQGAALVEFNSNTLAGQYSVQVSNNPTPPATGAPGTTPTPSIYTVVQDASSYNTGGQGGETKDWSYYIREGWKYIRFYFNPESGNAGTLNVQVRMFGNPPTGDAARSYTSGVPWKQSDILAQSVVQSGAGTVYYDYKLPQGAHGFYLYTDDLGVSGASTLTTTVYSKDGSTGQLQSLGVNATIPHAAGFNTMIVNTGYSSPYPVATPPANTTVIGVPVPQDIVIGNAFTGTGATTFTQNVVPVQ